MGTMVRLFLFLQILYGTALAQGDIEATREKETNDSHESRIILRYESGAAGSLHDRVKQLQHIAGIRKAEALPRLDMAVVACESGNSEDEMLEILQAQDGVELAVPDTWLHLNADKRRCSANPECSALGMHGLCCPTPDGLRLGCCEEDAVPDRDEHGLSTLSLQSWHGGFVAAMPWGGVGFYPDMSHPDTHFFVVPHSDGYNSLKTWYGTYLVTTPSGRIASWHRGHPHADDFEKFKFVYNKDGSLSLRSKFADKYVAAEHPSWAVLSGDRDEIDEWEKFNVTFTNGKDTVIPNDKFLDKLWGMHHYGDRDIDAAEAWKIVHEAPPEGLVVAVIDTGIDYSHPDLKDQMWVNPNEIPDNGIDDDGNGIIDDVHGADFANNDGDPMDDQMHGTHCAGTIAGRGNNSLGVTGVAWQGVRLMAMKFLSASGGGRTSDAIKCLDYAVAMGAKLSSNSWGGGGSSSAMRVAIERAEQAGMLFIAAAGNEGSDNDQLPHYPSNYPTANIVSVASTTKTGSLSSFSCYGKETVDVAAPGSSIYSTVPKNKYASLSGTSMATPHVSGLAALIWLHRPGLTMPQVKQIIMDSSTPVDALQNSSLTDGRINARRALLLASSYDATYPPVHPPQAIAFADADPEVGRIRGIATVTAAADESDITYYSLHFISVAGFLMEQVGTVNKTGMETLSVELVNLTIPKYVTGLAVVAANQSAKAGPGKAAVVEIKDYGVPKYGPGKGFWGGDVDGRGGYVAGSIKFERAVSEKTITHYNLYWKDAGGSFLGKVPAAGFKTPSCEGDCDLLDMNFSGGVYTYSRGPYTNNEMAMISFSGPATVTVTKFMTEKYYDHLEVGGEQLTGTRLVLPRRIELESGPQKIVWSTDRSEVESGWSLELVQTGTVGEYALPSVQPPSWEVEIKASYSDTEGELASVATLSDFDAETMPPSAALTPRELRFLDLHTEQHMIQGSIEFLSPLNCSGSITDYEVIFANAEGKAVDGFQWKLTAPTNCSALLQVPVAAMTVPSAATQIIVTPENKNGKGLAASIPLLDVVRSLPINATFTGDRDPARNQVKGGVRITPAENPTGITAYAVYFLNGTEKAKLLGRVASALDEPVVYEFHVIVKPSQRSLLVVSVYEDAEMDEGVTLEFTDFVEEEPEPNMPGRFLAEQQTLDLEPWLRRPRQPAWNEVQLLWTDQGKEADAQSKKSVEIRSDRRVMGVLTIPGVLSSTSSTFGSGQTGQTFVPPSFETRKTLVSALAESLPAVSREQLRLTKGQMQTCQVALGSKGLRQVPNGACLVVHFEVLPDATLAVHAKYLQDFLDRVEARLIALSRGSSAAEKLNRLLTKRLSDSGAIALPPGGVWAVVGEPQQVAPKVRSGGRALATSGLSQQTVSGVWDEELESEQETSPVMLAVSVGAVLGAISAAGIAAMRFANRKREPLASAASVNPVPADAAAAIDVNVQHD